MEWDKVYWLFLRLQQCIYFDFHMENDKIEKKETENGIIERDTKATG